MNEITQYKTARGEDPETLDRQVNEALKAGYQLYGRPYSVGSWMCQALVKCEKRDSLGF